MLFNCQKSEGVGLCTWYCGVAAVRAQTVAVRTMEHMTPRLEPKRCNLHVESGDAEV